MPFDIESFSKGFAAGYLLGRVIVKPEDEGNDDQDDQETEDDDSSEET